jgi:hypothetical protein
MPDKLEQPTTKGEGVPFASIMPTYVLIWNSLFVGLMNGGFLFVLVSEGAIHPFSIWPEESSHFPFVLLILDDSSKSFFFVFICV